MGKIMMNGKQYGVGGIEKAKDISYDNTSSGMSATNVQGALDEVKSGLTNVQNAISPFTSVGGWLSNVDLNSFNTSGFYPIGGNSSNAPAEWGILFVIRTMQDITDQMYFSGVNIYVREARGGTWTAWKQL